MSNGVKIRKKKQIENDVLTEARARIVYLFKNHDYVSVSFSGGKDSTACLNLVMEEATRLKKLPLRVIYFDVEAIQPETTDYVRRVSKRDDVELEWYCLPIPHRNACSNDEPFWECWDPDKKDLWIYPMPPEGIANHRSYARGESFQDFAHKILRPNECLVQGLRAEESLRRQRIVSSKKNDNYISRFRHHSFAYPIYDWKSSDVWLLVRQFGYDYNVAYDVMNRTGMFENLLRQRVCPPYGEEPLRGLWLYAQCWPDMWHKMLARVPGVATAWRYANTELYSNSKKPDGLDWEGYCKLLIENYSESEIRDHVKDSINRCITFHETKTNDAIHEEIAHPISGASWKFFCKIAIKGDTAGRQERNMTTAANARRDKLGITLEEAFEKYGK